MALINRDLRVGWRGGRGAAGTGIVVVVSINSIHGHFWLAL